VDIPDTRYAWIGDSAIAYQVVGDGAIDLVYLPPSFSNLDVHWEYPPHARFLERLASFSRLIIVDRRGWGVSDRVTPGSFPPLEVAAGDLNAVLDSVGSTEAALFGGAEAGWIASIAAATYPDRYSALVLYQNAATWVRTEDTPWNNSPEQWQAQVKRWLDVGTEAFAAEWIEGNEPSLADDPGGGPAPREADAGNDRTRRLASRVRPAQHHRHQCHPPLDPCPDARALPTREHDGVPRERPAPRLEDPE
jgi:pimeloyl-ACP methyl ester carboxylesterase